MIDGYMGHAVLRSSAEDRSSVWLELRKTTIGGSDAGAILGLNPYMTARDLFFDKQDPQGIVGNAFVDFGIMLEPFIKTRRADDQTIGDYFGAVVERSGTWAHPEHIWMTANVDAVIESGFLEVSHGLEIKTSGKSWDGVVPDHYYAQCQHYMMVTGFDRWEIINAISTLDRVAVMAFWARFGDRLDAQEFWSWVASKCEIESITIDADPVFQSRMLEREIEFLACLEAGEPPVSVVPEGEITLLEVEAPDIFGLVWELCEIEKERGSDAFKALERSADAAKESLKLRLASLGPVKKVNIGASSATWVKKGDSGYWRFNLKAEE